MRTCSVKRPYIDRIYNVQVVLRVQPTPQRGTGVGKERGSHEGENLRDRVRGCKSLTLVPLVVSRVNSSNVIKWNSEPEKCYPKKSTIPLAKGDTALPPLPKPHYPQFLIIPNPIFISSLHTLDNFRR